MAQNEWAQCLRKMNTHNNDSAARYAANIVQHFSDPAQMA